MFNIPYRWVIVAAGGLLGCVAIGAMFSLPVLLTPISQNTNWSVTGVSQVWRQDGPMKLAVQLTGGEDRLATWRATTDRQVQVGAFEVHFSGDKAIRRGQVVAPKGRRHDVSL